MSGIVWLASYPKSGNTWLRVFLSNLLSDGETPARINALRPAPVVSSPGLLDDELGYDVDCLSQDEQEALYPELFQRKAEATLELTCFKVHNAYTKNARGQWIFPPMASRFAIYLARNPLDVAASFAAHSGNGSLDKVIRLLSNPAAQLASPGPSYARQLPQRLLSWSEHLRSWTEVAPIPVHAYRYEDLVRDPLGQFTALSRHFDATLEPARIERAVRFSDFTELRRQEAASGFRERPPGSEAFFRRGQPGAWRQQLSPQQVQSVIDNHGDAMRRWGYLDSNGKPV